MTTKSGGTEKPPTDKERTRDSHLKTDPAQQAAETFADAYVSDGKKGAITRAAQKAYPNQNKQAASVTGSRLLKDPRVREMIARRRAGALQAANITRTEVMGLLAQQSMASLGDIPLNAAGTEIDMKLARELGVDHLLREITITERSHARRVPAGKDSKGRQKYRTETHKRVTTKFKIHDPQKAMDLLSEIAGWKREPGKNPDDIVRATYQSMRADARYSDLPEDVLAKLVGMAVNRSAEEVLAAIK